jgi:hypothetical protein
MPVEFTPVATEAQMRKAVVHAAIAVMASAVVSSASAAPVTATPITAAGPDAALIGSVSMGSNARLSAAVYDASGQLVRHLYETAPRTGTIALHWDGRDDDGNELPSGRYNWRAITTSAAGSDDGGVGNGGKPLAGLAYEVTAQPRNPVALAYGPDGDLYVHSNYEETQSDILRYAPGNLGTGRQTWGSHDGWNLQGTAITVDRDYVYAAAHLMAQPGASDWTQYGIYRLDARTGAEAPWPGVGRIMILPSWRIGAMPVTGLAVDDTYLWVVDPAGNRVGVFTKSDGQPALILGGTNWAAIPSPRGIVTDGANRFWITTGDHAARYIYNAATHALELEARTPALDRPYGLAWSRAGSTSTLFVSEIGGGHVRRYDVSGTVPVQQAVWFATMPAGGRVTNTTLGWKYDNLSWVPGGSAAIAASPDGATLAVADNWNGRTLFYDARTGAVRPDRLQGITNWITPDVEPGSTTGNLVSRGREYEVDYNRTDTAYGHPWRLTNNWWPADNIDNSFVPFGAVIRRLHNSQYLYVIVAAKCGYPTCSDTPPGPFPWGGILIYRLNTDGPGQGMKQVAAIRRDTPGLSNYPDQATAQLDIITDTNGSGVLGDPGDATETTNWKGYLPSNPSAWVDAQGTLWFALGGTLDQAPGSFVTTGVASLPLRGFDSRRNPIYRLDDFGVRAPIDRDPVVGAAAPVGTEVKYDTISNRLFTQVDSGEFDPLTNGGGNAVEVRDLRTGQRSVFSGYSRFDGPRSGWRDTVAGMAVDTGGGYFYTAGSGIGLGQRISMYTWDGLTVAQARTQLPTFSDGFFDESMSLTAYTAAGGTRYVYGEDDLYGRNTRYAFTNVVTTQRSGSDPTTGNTSGDFAWTAPSTTDGMVAWWRFDTGRRAFGPALFVADSTGHGHWGTLETARAATWWQPDGGVHNGAITFDGTPPYGVHFRRNTWLSTPDHLIDNPDYQSALTFASWVRTTGSGVVIGYQNAATIESAPPPSAAKPIVYIGQDGHAYAGTLTGTACAKPQAVSAVPVNDGQWHHIALTVAPSGQTLYVDGQPVDSTDCPMATADLGFTSLANGYTTQVDGTAWPSTPGGYFHYVGSLDDIRLYNRTLSPAEIQTLATVPAPGGPLAHWTFDESSGTLAADATDHGKDVSVTGGTWVPGGGRIGGALAFDGNTRVVMPKQIAELAPLTFATWFKTSASGVILGDQRGPYPTPWISGWLGEGVGPTSTHALEIGADGTVRSLLMNQLLGGPGKSPDLRDNQWHHVAVTSTNTGGSAPQFTVTLYLDGQPIDSATTPQGIWADVRPDSQLGIGRDQSGTWTTYTGLLDDLRIYPRALTATEVASLASP